MRAMRKLEAENIAPEREGVFQIRDGDAGVIGGEDPKGHVKATSNAQRRTSNLQW
jgi:hypothetical protein